MDILSDQAMGKVSSRIEELALVYSRDLGVVISQDEVATALAGLLDRGPSDSMKVDRILVARLGHRAIRRVFKELTAMTEKNKALQDRLSKTNKRPVVIRKKV